MKHGDSIDPLFDAIETLCTVSASQPSLPESARIVIHSEILNEDQSNTSQQLCVQCHRGFKTSAQLKHHIASRHLNIRPFPCNVCNSSFTQVAHLKAHRRIHSGERPFSCQDCGSSFVQLSHLKTHQKLHTGEKPYVCDICAARFRQQSNLKSHRLIHTGERPYKCDQCSSSFVQVGHLKSHKRIHTNERPFKCKQCLAAFRQISNLRNHERSHLNKKIKMESNEKTNGVPKNNKLKSFVCTQCNFSSYSKDFVFAHFRAFHDSETPLAAKKRLNKENDLIFMCSDCGFCFDSCESIKGHMKLHAGSKMYFSCSSCQQTFIDENGLLEHKNLHHPAPVDDSIRLGTIDCNDVQKIDLLAVPSETNHLSDLEASSCQVLFIEERDRMHGGQELINLNVS